MKLLHASVLALGLLGSAVGANAAVGLDIHIGAATTTTVIMSIGVMAGITAITNVFAPHGGGIIITALVATSAGAGRIERQSGLFRRDCS